MLRELGLVIVMVALLIGAAILVFHSPCEPAVQSCLDK